MTQTIVKDARKRNRILQVTGHVKPSGTICSKVTNDSGKEYFVTIKPNGITSCTYMNGFHREECPGHHHRGHCRHTDKTRDHVSEFKFCDELTKDEPRPAARVTRRSTTKTRSTAPRNVLLSLRDNRTFNDKVFGSLAMSL